MIERVAETLSMDGSKTSKGLVESTINNLPDVSITMCRNKWRLK
jgi:hypothetical protein